MPRSIYGLDYVAVEILVNKLLIFLFQFSFSFTTMTLYVISWCSCEFRRGGWRHGRRQLVQPVWTISTRLDERTRDAARHFRLPGAQLAVQVHDYPHSSFAFQTADLTALCSFHLHLYHCRRMRRLH